MKTNGISDQVRLLHSALIQRGVDAQIEKWDKHKHIDLSIDTAGLYIEVDGDDHYTNSETIIRDLKRDYFSNEDGFDTLHFPNHVIDLYLDEVADALVEVCKERYK
jgi:very-short-patch-repair endonuclease